MTCPSCGSAETLEGLAARRDELEAQYIAARKRRALEDALNHATGKTILQGSGNRSHGLSIGSVLTTPSGSTTKVTNIVPDLGYDSAKINSKQIRYDRTEFVPTNAKTCTSCGTVWNSTAIEEAQELKKQIAELREQMFDAVERLGHLADDELAQEARESEEILRDDEVVIPE